MKQRTDSQQGVYMSIREKLVSKKGLTDTEIHIADYILEHPQSFVSEAVKVLTDNLYVSKSSLNRFANKLGFQGHRDLCIHLAAEIGASSINERERVTENFPFHHGDSKEEITGKLSRLFHQTVDDVIAKTDIAQLSRVADNILKHKSVLIFGKQESALLGAEFQIMLMRSQIKAASFMLVGFPVSMASNTDMDELAFIISFGGESFEIVEAAKQLKRHQTEIILLTGPKDNTLSRMADEVIRVDVKECDPKIGPLSSSVAMKLVLDTIACFVFDANYEKNVRELIETNNYQEAIRGEWGV